MTKIVLAAESAKDSRNASPTGERLINCYAVAAPQGSRAKFILNNVPGTSQLSTTPGPFLRAMCPVEGNIYTIGRGKLCTVAETGAVTELADIADDVNTSMAAHRDKLTIASQGDYLLYASGSVSQPTGGAFDAVGSVAFLDQFTLMSELDGRRIQWSAVGDPATLDGLNFATAESSDDKIIRIIAISSYLWVFKENSTEIWASTGRGGFEAFSRVQGGTISRGLKAFNLLCDAKDKAFLIGNDGVAYLTANGNLSPVSTPPVETAIEDGSPTQCFYYEDRGQPFCVIRFSDRPSWVLDLKTQRWHERSSGVNHSEWSVIASVFAYNRWQFGTDVGQIYTLRPEPIDASEPMRRTAVSRPIYMDGRLFSVALLEVLGRFGYADKMEIGPSYVMDENGFPILDEDGRPLYSEGAPPDIVRAPARMWIRVSRDGGQTFGLPKIREIGRLGEYNARATYRAMGQFRSFAVEVNITDPYIIPILGELPVVIS